MVASLLLLSVVIFIESILGQLLGPIYKASPGQIFTLISPSNVPSKIFPHWMVFQETNYSGIPINPVDSGRHTLLVTVPPTFLIVPHVQPHLELTNAFGSVCKTQSSIPTLAIMLVGSNNVSLWTAEKRLELHQWLTNRISFYPGSHLHFSSSLALQGPLRIRWPSLFQSSMYVSYESMMVSWILGCSPSELQLKTYFNELINVSAKIQEKFGHTEPLVLDLVTPSMVKRRRRDVDTNLLLEASAGNFSKVQRRLMKCILVTCGPLQETLSIFDDTPISENKSSRVQLLQTWISNMASTSVNVFNVTVSKVNEMTESWKLSSDITNDSSISALCQNNVFSIIQTWNNSLNSDTKLYMENSTTIEHCRKYTSDVSPPPLPEQKEDPISSIYLATSVTESPVTDVNVVHNTSSPSVNIEERLKDTDINQIVTSDANDKSTFLNDMLFTTPLPLEKTTNSYSDVSSINDSTIPESTANSTIQPTLSDISPTASSLYESSTSVVSTEGAAELTTVETVTQSPAKFKEYNQSREVLRFTVEPGMWFKLQIDLEFALDKENIQEVSVCSMDICTGTVFPETIEVFKSSDTYEMLGFIPISRLEHDRNYSFVINVTANGGEQRRFTAHIYGNFSRTVKINHYFQMNVGSYLNSNITIHANKLSDLFGHVMRLLPLECHKTFKCEELILIHECDNHDGNIKLVWSWRPFHEIGMSCVNERIRSMVSNLVSSDGKTTHEVQFIPMELQINKFHYKLMRKNVDVLAGVPFLLDLSALNFTMKNSHMKEIIVYNQVNQPISSDYWLFPTSPPLPLGIYGVPNVSLELKQCEVIKLGASQSDVHENVYEVTILTQRETHSHPMLVISLTLKGDAILSMWQTMSKQWQMAQILEQFISKGHCAQTTCGLGMVFLYNNVAGESSTELTIKWTIRSLMFKSTGHTRRDVSNRCPKRHEIFSLARALGYRGLTQAFQNNGMEFTVVNISMETFGPCQHIKLTPISDSSYHIALIIIVAIVVLVLLVTILGFFIFSHFRRNRRRKTRRCASDDLSEQGNTPARPLMLDSECPPINPPDTSIETSPLSGDNMMTDSNDKVQLSAFNNGENVKMKTFFSDNPRA